MLNEPTLEKLKTMRLEGLAAAWLEQQRQPNTAELSFDERLGLLVNAEWTRLFWGTLSRLPVPTPREPSKAVPQRPPTSPGDSVPRPPPLLSGGTRGTGRSGQFCVPTSRLDRSYYRL